MIPNEGLSQYGLRVLVPYVTDEDGEGAGVVRVEGLGTCFRFSSPFHVIFLVSGGIHRSCIYRVCCWDSMSIRPKSVTEEYGVVASVHRPRQQ